MHACTCKTYYKNEVRFLSMIFFVFNRLLNRYVKYIQEIYIYLLLDPCMKLICGRYGKSILSFSTDEIPTSLTIFS